MSNQSKAIDVDELQEQQEGNDHAEEENDTHRASRAQSVANQAAVARENSDASSSSSSSKKGSLKTTGLDEEDYHDDDLKKKAPTPPSFSGLYDRVMATSCVDVDVDDEALKKKARNVDDEALKKKEKATTNCVDVDEFIADLTAHVQALPDQNKTEQDERDTIPHGPGAHFIQGRSARLNATPPEPESGNVNPPDPFSGTYSPQCLVYDEEVALEATVVVEEAPIEDTETNTTNTSGPASGFLSLELIEGTAMHDTPRTKLTTDASPAKWIWLFFILVVVAVASSLLLVVTVEEDSRDPGPHSLEATFEYKPNQHYPPFLDDLPADIVMEIEKHNTPECMANQWMWRDPYLHTYSRDRQLQRYAFVVFYFYTHGDQWTRNDYWLSWEVSECEWYQNHSPNHYDYPVCDEDENLIVFDFHNNNLQGGLPGLTNYYPHMRWFNVADNKLAGPPPPLASKIKNLEAFILSNNQLEGQLIGDAGFVAFNVRIVKLDGNRFHGYVNPVFRVLPKLEVLNLTSNAFANDVPFQLQYTSKLQYLGMADNQWYGTLPSELSKLTDLRQMDWGGNQNIVGSIPSEFGAMTHLQRLDVIGTQVTGSIPEVMCQRQEQALEVIVDCTQVQCCS